MIAKIRCSIRDWLFIVAIGLLAFLISAPGCKRSSGAVPVRGHVSYRGTPIANAALIFYPATGRPVAAPVIKGEYSTELMPGEYTATVNIGANLPPGYKEGDPVPKIEVSLPPEYTIQAKSTIKATVNAGQSEPIDFDLK